MLKRKLLKRALPVILSVAMIFQSTPATALAAEDMGTKAMEAETAEGMDSSDSGDAEASDNSNDSDVSAVPDDASADNASEEQTPNEQAAEEQKTEEPKTEESKSEGTASDEEQKPDNADTAEQPSTEEAKAEESASEETASGEVQNPDTANPAGEQSTSNGQDAEGTIETEPAATEIEAADAETDVVNAGNTDLKTDIIIKEQNLNELLTWRWGAYHFTQDTEAEVLTYKRPYNNSSSAFVNIMQDLKANSNYLNVEIDGEKNEELLNHLEFQWQKVPAEGEPVNVVNQYPLDAGSYRLRISLDEVPELCKKAESAIYFVIEPAELNVGGIFVDDTNRISVSPNTTVAMLKERMKKEYTLSYEVQNDEYNSFETKAVDKDVAGFDIKVTVVDGYDTAESKKPLEDTVQLAKNGDYRMYLEVVIPDSLKTNFTYDNTKLYSIAISDLVVPKVIVEKKDPGKEITTVYDSAATEKTLTDLVEAAIASKRVVYIEKDENGEEKEIDIPISEDNSLTLVWYVRKTNIAGKDDSELVYKEYDGIPKDAGEYYVSYKYAGEPNVYDEAESDRIKVTIEPISLILKPNASAGTAPELIAGMSSKEVTEELAKVGYELYPYTTNAEGKETLDAAPYLKSSDAAAQGFWGVSYNDKNVTQYYVPVFGLQYREAEKTEDGKIVKDGNQIKYGEWKAWNKQLLEASIGESGEKEIEYRIAFTGKKAVYTTGGYGRELSITDISTMAAEKNYLVRADEDALNNDNYVLAVEVNNVAATEIDITEIVKTFQEKINGKVGDDAELGTSEEKPLWRVYNRNPLYEKREDYKKAGVKEKGAESNFITNGSDEALSYQWYRKSGSSWNKVGGTAVDEAMLDSNLTTTGAYKLVITYTDADHKRQPATKDVYFEIRQQEVIIVGEAFEAYVGDATSQLDFAFRAYAVPGNEPDDSKIDLSQAQQISFDELFWEGITDYQLTQRLEWEVQRQEKNDKGEDVDFFVSAAGEQYIEGYHYRACLHLSEDFDNDQYTNINQSASNEDTGIVYHQKWADITLKNVGTEELELLIDRDKLPDPRVYDGTEQGVTEALKSAVTVVLKNDHEQVVSDINLNFDLFYECDDSSFNGYVRGKEPSDETEDFVNTLDGGTYYLRIYFEGNEKYKNFDKTFNGDDNRTDNNYNAPNADEVYTISVTKKPITIKPFITAENLAAGELVSELYDTETSPIVINWEDIPERDRNAFTYGTWYNAKNDKITGYPALADINYDTANGSYTGLFFPAYQCDGNRVWGDSHLRFGKEYQITFNPNYEKNQLKGLYASNYKVTYQNASYTVDIRGNATITEAYNNKYKVRLRPTKTNKEAGRSQKIVPLEGIPFTENFTWDDKKVDGNFFGFNIYAPDEFWGSEYYNNSSNFIYKNSIELAGGMIVRDFPQYTYGSDRYATVVFDVTNLDELTEAEKVKTFSICWEDGYIEEFTVDFTGAELEADLRKAVAPKSLAFNGISTKMVIGENQHLDVKLTKVQLGDTVRIGYRTVPEDSDVLYINEETGLVTALKVSSSPVTVQAYAYKMEGGEKVPFDKPVANAKITVNNVASPAIKKIESGDVNGLVHYTKVDNGYRRELYVLPGKNIPESTFEGEIEKLEKGQKTELTVAPVYDVEHSGSYWDEKAKEYQYTVPRGSGYWNSISGNNVTVSGNGIYLEPNQDYSVYIRNVSAARTLVNGKVVDKSAKGVVKSFKTTKPQVQQLVSFFDENSAAQPMVDANGMLTDKDSYNYPNRYVVDLASKSVQLSVWGLYKDTAANADNNDLVSQMLPVKGNASVMNPKLSYYIYDYVSGRSDSAYINNTNFKQSAYATINNKGKITLKGVGLNGEAWLRVIVKADNGRINGRTLLVTAQPDAVKGKSAKLKVGDTINLWDYLEYTQTRKKVPNYKSGSLEIVNQTDAENAGFIIQNLNAGGCFVTATAEVKSGFELQIKDNSIKSSPEAEAPTATIKLTAGALDPVKGLKVAYVDDQSITVNFTHAGKPSDFLIEVKDGRGNLVSRKLEQVYGNNQYDEDHCIKANEPSYRQNLQQYRVGALTYFEKTKTYAYTINSRLVRQSSYSISVTAMYNDLSAKTVTKKAKTTNIPASHRNLAVESVPYTGSPIYVTRSNNGNAYPLRSNPYLTSGNAYTLILYGDDEVPQTRATDTLTWKSSNPKVASIKANAGTYTAALKAVKAGETDIEVTSKITKKVIARYKVCIKPVSGGNTYYGDYEPTDYFRQWDPLYEGPVEVLTLSNHVVVKDKDANETTWVSFTAPTFGEYSFSGYGINGYYWNNLLMYDEKNGETEYEIDDYVLLEANQKIYFKMVGPFELEARCVTSFAKLTTASPVHVADSAWVSFIAPEDNYYTFRISSNNGSHTYFEEYRGEDKSIDVDVLEFDEWYGEPVSLGVGMKAGETILLKTSAGGTVSAACRVVEASLDKENDNKKDTTLTNEIKERWFTFKAPITAEYTITTTGTVDKIAYYKGLDSNSEWIYDIVSTGSPIANAFRMAAKGTLSALADEAGSEAAGTTTPEVNKVRIRMNKDDIVVIKVALSEDTVLEGDEAANGRKITVQVSQPKVDALTMSHTTEAPKQVTVAENEEAAWLSFTIPADGAYTFKAVDNDNNNVSVSYYSNKMNSLATNCLGDYQLLIPYGSGADKISAGDTIYLKITKTAKVSVTNLSADAVSLTAGKAEAFRFDKSGQYWYTFTAPQDGDYIFRAEANMAAEGATSILGNRIDAFCYDKIGGVYKGYYNIFDGKTESAFLKMGQSVAICLNARDFNDGYKMIGYLCVDNKTTAQSITAAGVEVSLNSAQDKAGTTKWYSFTATAGGDYQFAWEPDTAGSGDVTVTLYKNQMNGTAENGMSTSLSMGDTVYIKITQTTEKAVKGRLNITVPSSESATKLVSGQESEAVTLTNGQEKYYTFIAPKSTKYIVTTTVTEPKDASVSTRFENWESYINSDGETGILTAGRKYTFRVTANSEKATFKILVQPIEVQELAAAGANIEAGNNKPGWYVYKAPTAGRYSISCAENAQLSVNYYNKDFDDISNQEQSGYYYEAGEIIAYIKASTTAATKQSAAFTAAKVTPAAAMELKKDDTSVSLKANEWKYFEYTAVNQDTHVLTITVPQTNGVMADKVEYTRGMKNDFIQVDVGENPIPLNKGEKIFIRMTSSSAASFSYKLAERGITELTAGATSGEVELALGKTAYFSLLVRENGEFTFKTQDVSSKTASLSFTEENFEALVRTSTGNGFCFTARGTYNKRITFGVTNNSADTVKFKIDTKRVSYEELTEAAPIKDITLAKGDLTWIKFTAPEDGRYTFSAGETEGLSLEGLDAEGTYSLYSDMPIKKDSTITMYLTYSGSEESAKTTVSVKHLVPEAITDKAIELEAGASKWVQYTAEKEAMYTFAVKDQDDQEVQLYAYKTFIADYPSNTGYTITRWLKSGDTLLFKLTNDSEETQRYTFTVTAQEGTGTYTFVFNTYGDTQDMTFTAPKTGTYRITGFVPEDDKSDFRVWVNKSHEDGWGGYINVWYSNNNRILFEQELKQGDTVYLDMVPWSYSAGSSSPYEGSISIQIEQVD